MAEEVRIVIRAEDKATDTLRKIKSELSDTSSRLKEVGTDAGAWGDTLRNNVTPAVNATEASAVRLSRAMLPVSFGLRQLGLMGPAAFVQMAGSASGASIAIDGTTVSVGALEIALGPLLLIILAIVAAFAVMLATMAAISAFSSFLGDSIRVALDENASPAAVRANNAILQMQNTVLAIRRTVGNALLQAFGPYLELIAAWFKANAQTIVGIVVGMINIIITLINAAARGVVNVVNLAIRALQPFLNVYNLLTRKKISIAPVSWSNIGLIATPKIDFGNTSLEGAPKTEGGGGGGGAALGGGGGGAGTGAGARLTSPLAAKSPLGSADVERLQLQTLERVDGRMQELIDLLKTLPQTTRDAIVTYTGGTR